MSIIERARRGRRGPASVVALLMMLTTLSFPSVASATHPEASLAGSDFEIDEDANLRLDDADPSVDWGSLAHPNGPELRQTDADTGQTDDSYKGGVKEDTECPAETTGSIPNNKSDLLTFHVYEEPGSGGHPGFLNLAWSRVSDPSGTTLMDFEFNQSTTACTTGPNVERTTGDLLIEYAIDQGGARADISGRFWTGTAWGDPIDLDSGTMCGGGPCAAGTINQTVIPAGESDGLGEKQPRTFGEAQIDLRLIFDDESCTSFGSAMLKSRSSTSFTSQLKDFISPIPIDLQNCGNVIIRKQTDPDGATVLFDFDKDFATDPASSDTFSLSDDGVQNYNDTVLFGSGYTVSENLANLPAGWDFVDVNCDDSTGVTPQINGAVVTFDIDSDSDVLDCTFRNRARGDITVVKRTVNATGTFEFTSNTLSPSPFELTTTDVGEAGQDSTNFDDLAPGTYDVAESTPPTGWELTSATCDDGSDPSSIGLSAGESVTCTFVNTATASLTVVKQTGVTTGSFDYTTSGGLDPSTFTLTTTDVGAAGQDSQPYPGIAPGDYGVAETVPMGWNLDSASCDNGDDPSAITLGVGDDVTCTFVNSPQEGAIEITKTRKHAALGSGDHPHEGVTFTISGGSLAAPVDVVTDANGVACLDGLLLSQFAGDYSVEEDVPLGYAADGVTTKTVTVTAESSCGDGNEATVSFGNTPLTNVTVSVDSQVDGGTASTIVCTDSQGNQSSASTGADGDGQVMVSDLLPTDPTVTLTCEITIDP